MNKLYQETVWKDIKGFEGHYQVSSDGRARSLDRMTIMKNGYPRPCKGRELIQAINNGYLQLCLHLSGKSSPKLVHHLVAFTFISERPEGLEINHINGIKTDNRVCNLEYVTPKENSRHALQLGLKIPKRGSALMISKLDEEKVLIVKERLSKDESCTSIAKSLGLNTSTIRDIKIGKTWKHV
jgi:hypothetical protein